jgi:hypothetical protein
MKIFVEGRHDEWVLAVCEDAPSLQLLSRLRKAMGLPLWEARPYRPTDQEITEAVAGDAARRGAAPFVVVDEAQTLDGRWLVIERNDSPESGYAGVSPLGV